MPLDIIVFFLDIDECVEAVLAGGQACMDESMLCINTIGSFVCSCPGNTEFIDGECREPIGMCGAVEKKYADKKMVKVMWIQLKGFQVYYYS